MRRSEINGLLKDAERFLAEHRVSLPGWASRSPGDWNLDASQAEIVENQLGWDITDFGSGDFHTRGLLLFTLRNGNPNRDKKTYAEKLMIVEEGQETPLHFHWVKMEDIIVRGGGRLLIEVHPSNPDGTLGQGAVALRVDGVSRTLPAGAHLVLKPGESVCLEQGVYHRFWGEPGTGRVLVGEVSMVNDDRTDNRFLEAVGRFPEVEEDEAPYRLLVTDYRRQTAN